MKKLLQHLLAHMKTSDDWILIYDSRGSFSRIVGECILMDPYNFTTGVFLGVPVWRECACKNAQLLDVEYFVRIKREYLNTAIARIKELIGSCV